ncbi:MAG: PHP domain-containing protein [Candidatus Latescibacteria bacterium]|jgi:putative hydrolase|nr:PHP domain-containing protein [Candidatus Latescibacterota bacterium]
MIECDLHVHSLRSTCGFHTLLEIVSIIQKKGLKAFALTDHSPVHQTPRSYFSVMLKRMPPVIDGVRVFKGIEATILDDTGDLDLPEFDETFSYEIILAALHKSGHFEYNINKEKNTRAVITALKKHPKIHVVTHPFYKVFPLDLDALTDTALETNTAIEINNSYILTNKANIEALEQLLELAGKKGNMLSVNSDGHMFNEIGKFDLALEFIIRYGIENYNIVNRTLESTLEFLGLEE